MNTGLLSGSLLLLLFMAGCSDSSPASATPVVQAVSQELREVEWIDLLPEDDLAALMDRPAILDGIVEGSAADDMASGLASQITSDTSLEDAAQMQRYQAALESTRTRAELNGVRVRIPGFIVPINFDDQQRVIEFFLVPFFGACIHVPPPPPNQIVHVEVEDGFVLESIYDPVWLEGVLFLEQNVNGLGQSAYSLQLEKRELYYD
ncbi:MULTISPECIES: DUF3299 domain-containing protein [unclassified Oceanobacter]|jgi:hypothetical protein|uniref:DUF3299 domain-containing protein n=2 Tax=Gammaproteobacteria TaxID=1236 RepID=UPI002736939C|nr:MULTISPECIES: DUF3299 domain-containing protein [unclassified Oceanobacter]MDP2506413.1 DUF3299 domain-containing protein [Oceanobacter sp. 3_MG-2023]MDP2548780.1 DUF3299 domain-containing protein [Oceanobacter sp. 4_MG-2023]MDP2609205.1 DUF3299 domain-containing protein [Oceanobacter sp. 1_MG-2023]MDP2612503.1 DUF3299 domain-containing protein [Oceanobacter sp. 2_MG-2023]